MSKEQLSISEDYLRELLDYIGRSLVGKMLKRFEIIENRETIKNEAKELIYEQLRTLRDLILAHNKGLDMIEFKFKREHSYSK